MNENILQLETLAAGRPMMTLDETEIRAEVASLDLVEFEEINHDVRGLIWFGDTFQVDLYLLVEG